MLLDHLVCGCSNRRLQCKLLSEDNLNYAKAMKLALAVESVEQGAKQLQGQQPTAHIQVMQRPKPKNHPTPLVCSATSDTPLSLATGAVEIICNQSAVSRTLHAITARSEGTLLKFATQGSRSKLLPPRNLQTKWLQRTPRHTPCLKKNMYHSTSHRPPPRPFHVTMQLNNSSLTMEVDTGQHSQ